MSAALALARRELSSLLRTPAGWIIAALYAFLTTAVFALRTLDPGQPASMRFFFATAASLLAVVMPAVSMRLLAEEARAGTLEPLLTSPASHGSIIVGKFAGVLAYTALMLLPTLALVVTLIAVSDRAPDPGPIIAGYLSLMLVAALYLALGTLTSACTSSQTLAFLAAFLIAVGHLIGTAQLAPRLPEPASSWIAASAINPRVADFARGIIDLKHVAFFIIWTAWLLVLATVALARRRITP